MKPLIQNKGIGTKTIKYIETKLRSDGAAAIRLDAFTENQAALSMYGKLGYNTVGYADWRKGRFHLMEKVL